MYVLIAAILVALLLFLLGPLGVALAAAVLAAGFAIYRRDHELGAGDRRGQAIRESSQTPAAVAALPAVSNFTITAIGAAFTPSATGPDSVEAVRFKSSLRSSFELVQASAAVGRLPVRTSLDLSQMATASVAALQPKTTIGKRVWAGIFVPPRILGDNVPKPAEVFVEPMAYPVIDLPMYEPLKDLSSELFLPNVNLIEPNSITLLETNQRFIESYMVGLNHEFARELLWREYPTDMRASTFRQFWDVRGFFDTDSLDDETLKEKLRDIPPLHLWSKSSKLGDHDNREQGRDNEEELVLVIRGELLKRYPTAVIYAHRACWQRKDVTPADKDKEPCSKSGGIDNTKERRLISLTPAEEAKPPRHKVLTPLYEAKIDPDIYFFGFDLTVEKAKGGTGEKPNDDPGWFFVIKERPGEPRFGLDTDSRPTERLERSVLGQRATRGRPDLSSRSPRHRRSSRSRPPATGDDEKTQQHDEDTRWPGATT